MNDALDTPSSKAHTWLEKLIHLLTGEPTTKSELVDIIRDAFERELLDKNSMSMIEGVIGVQELRVRDVMIPYSQMKTIDKNMTLNEIIAIVTQSGHSRFPVTGDKKDEVLGTLLAKDLLNYAFKPLDKFNIKDIIRPAIFIPESKRLDILLQEFRINRNHIAIVVDEYGEIIGLITIEDVLEQIVGSIKDEYDLEEGTFIQKHSRTIFSVKALTPLDEFNRYFDTNLEDETIDTIGGLIMKNIGHLPRQSETIDIQGFRFKILKADNRRIHLLQVTPLYVLKGCITTNEHD